MRLLKPLVLASRSPRRISLLQQIGIEAEVMPSDVDEVFVETTTPEQNALRLALAKAMDVSPRVENAIIIGADTIVVLNSTLLAKPADEHEAIRMLEMLSGHTHVVHTGLALLDRPSGKHVTTVESTRVTFREIPRTEIEEYVRGGSPMDKAGAYGIQDDYGAVFVSRIEGCYYNVVGFPLARFYKTLQEFQEQLTKRD
jgi:septum formation protein